MPLNPLGIFDNFFGNLNISSKVGDFICDLLGTRLDKKRDRHVDDVYKLRRKTVAPLPKESHISHVSEAKAGEILNIFRGKKLLEFSHVDRSPGAPDVGVPHLDRLVRGEA